MTNYPSTNVRILFTILPLIIEIVFSAVIVVAFLLILKNEMEQALLIFIYVLSVINRAFYLIIINFLLASYLVKKEFVIASFSDYLYIGKLAFFSWFIPLCALDLYFFTKENIFNHPDFQPDFISYLFIGNILLSLIHAIIVMITGRFILPKQ